MAARTALNLPEILSLILRHHEENAKIKDFCRLLIVNSTWFLEVVPIIWREASFNRVMEVRDRKRWELYASKVKFLENRIICGPMVDPDSIFPRLPSVHRMWIILAYGVEILPVKLRAPRLRELLLVNGKLTTQSLDRIAEHMPRLRKLFVGEEVTCTNIKSGDLRKFLDQMKDLETIHISKGMSHIVTERDALTRLTNNKTLRDLSLSACLTAAVAKRMAKTGIDFSQMRVLRLTLQTEALKQLAPTFPQNLDLTVRIRETNPKGLHYLVSAAGIKKLLIRFFANVNVMDRTLMNSFCRIKSLRYLEIDHPMCKAVEWPRYTEEQMREYLLQFPDLEEYKAIPSYKQIVQALLTTRPYFTSIGQPRIPGELARMASNGCLGHWICGIDEQGQKSWQRREIDISQLPGKVKCECGDLESHEVDTSPRTRVVIVQQ